MNKYNIKYIATIVFIAVFLIVGLHFYSIKPNTSASDDRELNISLESGFYDREQEITVQVPKGACVYYTEDCTEPDKEHGKLYQMPISIAAGEAEAVYVYRFKAYYEDGEESKTITRTYFTGSGILSRYTTNVLHLTGEPEDLFGYEKGIFVGGKLFDEFVEANPDAHYGGGVEANFQMKGKEWEREVYAECFDADGTRIFGQSCGVRIHGKATRLKNQKSFKLYARKEYDEQNEFRYPLLASLISEEGAVAQEHKRLVVRSGGTDNGFGYIRSELIGELANDAGFPDVVHSEPICVYINGEYKGIYWLENTFDAQYFVNRYGEYEGTFVVLEGSDVKKMESDEEETDYIDEYNQLYNQFSSMDLTVEENYQSLCEVLDVENYLAYFAIENYIGNGDWPGGNVKVYRYVTEENQYQEGTVFDGRYRHLLFDLDYGFGLLVERGTVGTTADQRTLNRIMGDKSPLFAALMEREDCRDYFVNYSCDLMNGAMSSEHVTEVLETKHESREAELRYMLEETSIQEDSLWVWEDESIKEYSNVELACDKIKEFAVNRPGAVLADMVETFGFDYGQVYTLYISKGNCRSKVQVNSNLIQTEEFAGVYAGAVPVKIQPSLAVNERFEYWVVNGEVRRNEELVLTDADIVEAQIQVEMIVSEAENPVLQLYAVRAKGMGDFIEIQNESLDAISTKGYFLSDDDNEYKYTLPTTVIQPGETKRFYGKDSTDVEGLGEFGLNFNIKAGETITLTRETEILERLYIPDLSEGGIYYRDGLGDGFVEKLGLN